MASFLGFLRNAAPLVGAGVGGAGGFWAGGPAGALAGANLGGMGGGYLANLLQYLEGNPNEEAQQEVLQQMRQQLSAEQQLMQQNPAEQQLMQGPSFAEQQLQQQIPENAYQDMQANEMRRFREDIMPQIAQQYASMGGLDTGSFGQSVGAGVGSLQERLGGLRQQYDQMNQNRLGQLGNMEQSRLMGGGNMLQNRLMGAGQMGQNRLGQLGGYLAGQQNVALGQQNAQNQRMQMGLQQQDMQNRMLNPNYGQQYGQAFNAGQGNMFQNYQQAGQPGFVNNALNAAANMARP